MKSVTVARDDDSGEPQGIEIHIGHEHMQKLGMKTPPEAGTKVSLQAHGKVSSAHTEMVDGKPKHRMSVTLTRGDMAPVSVADGKRADIRGDVEAAADAVAAKKGK
jgi:hypothetical protein